MTVKTVTIVLATYNRAALLRDTLRALQALDPVPDCQADIIVVDNNSSDETARVVADAARGARIPVAYLYESRQGKSFALNRALDHARSDLIALTDDDVLPAADWLTRIVANFRDHDVTFVFGKVLPRWGVTPPPEMLSPRAQDIWGPLAIVDYGEEAEAYRRDNLWQRYPIGANLAFSRQTLIAIGGWRTDLGKVNNTLISGEDHEIFIRLRRYGLYAGRYDPLVSVRHYVPASRLTRRYFRRWFYWHGKTQALMLDDLFPNLTMEQVPRIAGVPRFLYRQGWQQLVRWAAAAGGQDALGVLVEEVRTLQFLGLFLECWRRALRPRAAAGEPVASQPARVSLGR